MRRWFITGGAIVHLTIPEKMKCLVVFAVVLTSAFVHGQEVNEDAQLFPESEDDDLELKNLEERVSALEDNITEKEMLSVEIPSLAMEVEKMNKELKRMDAYIDKLYKYTKGIKKEIHTGNEGFSKSLKENEERLAKLPDRIEDLKKDLEKKQDKYSPDETEKYLRSLWSNWKDGKFGEYVEQPKNENQVSSPTKHAWKGFHHHKNHRDTGHGLRGHHGGNDGVSAWKQKWLAKKKQQWQQRHQEKHEAEDMVVGESEPTTDERTDSADEEHTDLVFR
ncbi:uncharacterized protein [Haliotis asinina]|uniref:uncharacterized protein n=1 Tax=Haliotis asinina TaxID=109174 RepID=UPI0035321CA1